MPQGVVCWSRPPFDKVDFTASNLEYQLALTYINGLSGLYEFTAGDIFDYESLREVANYKSGGASGGRYILKINGASFEFINSPQVKVDNLYYYNQPANQKLLITNSVDQRFFKNPYPNAKGDFNKYGLRVTGYNKNNILTIYFNSHSETMRRTNFINSGKWESF